MFLLFTLQPRAARLSTLSSFEWGVTVSCFSLLLLPVSLSLLFRLRAHLPAALRPASPAAEAAAFRAVIIAEWFRRGHAPTAAASTQAPISQPHDVQTCKLTSTHTNAATAP
jgi:hypothetical protein